jgi:hypothetical protein
MDAHNPNEPWSVPQELERRLPRPVRLSGLGITSCIVALACLVFGVGIAARVVNDELRREATNNSLAGRLTAEGRETEATVTSLRTGLGYVVGYEYTVDNRSYQKGVFITQQHWQLLQVGSPLAIRYLPSDPAQSFPAADPPSAQNQWAVALPLAAMALFFMVSFAAIQLSAVWPKRRLLARGSPARGIVTRCRVNQGRRGGYIVHYDFPLEDGSQCQGRALSRSQLAENSAVTILYDPNRPRRNALYPMEMVNLVTT